MRTLSKAQWRKKFRADKLQRENHRYRIANETRAATGYVSTFIDVDSGNISAHKIEYPKPSLEWEWEQWEQEQTAQLNQFNT